MWTPGIIINEQQQTYPITIQFVVSTKKSSINDPSITGKIFTNKLLFDIAAEEDETKNKVSNMGVLKEVRSSSYADP
jgi:hypothetical protein